MGQKYVSPSEIRAMLSRAMSEMYEEEVPSYGVLKDIVREVNEEVAETNPRRLEELGLTKERLMEERHGAIRLGSDKELRAIADMFEVMGMHASNYYEMTIINLPIHGTAFRPLTSHEMNENAFRMFTSLLRVDLLPGDIRGEVEEVLDKREIISDRAKELILLNKRQGGLTQEQAEEFVTESLKTFKWHKEANISMELYDKLKRFSGIAADIVGFKGPHINHLTPVAADIDKAHDLMHERLDKGVKEIIEGPPPREVAAFLLRQTSFFAIEEQTKSLDGKDFLHTARFGEIEKRGAAVTRSGKEAYDELLSITKGRAKEYAGDSELYRTKYAEILKEVFEEKFPDSFEELRKQGLIHVTYQVTEAGALAKGSLDGKSLDELVEQGFLKAVPQIYEDFLAISAAGIFLSNLGQKDSEKALENKLVSFKSQGEYVVYEREQKANFEKALGRKIVDPYDIYAAEEAQSIKSSYEKLGIQIPPPAKGGVE